MMDTLKHLDSIAREAYSGNYKRTGVLSTGELLYVALASGRMRELCPNDSIPYAVERIGDDWMRHMQSVWRSDSQPVEDEISENPCPGHLDGNAKKQKWTSEHYNDAQKQWCDDYESWTGFEPIMADYEAGRASFLSCAKASVRWYEMHTADMHLRISSMPIP